MTWRPSLVVVLALVALTVMIGGWILYETFRPRHPLDVLFQQVIREAPVGKSSAARWARLDASDRICPHVNRVSLNSLGLAAGYQDELPQGAENNGLLKNADLWWVYEDKNPFATCADHRIAALKIQIQRGTDQCLAHVLDLPSCDP